MNPLINEAAGSIQGGWILGVMTAVFLLTFLYWVWYAYAPAHKERMERAGWIPLEDDNSPSLERVEP